MVLREIITIINPETLAILAPPTVMASIARVKLDVRDAWAFDIALQALRLRQPKESSGPAMLSQDSEYSFRRPWSSCILNEGYCVKVYSTYEYFLK